MTSEMKHSPLANEDLRLVNALQEHPRASWTTLGSSLGADPVTLARRWRRMEREGVAWIAVYHGIAARPIMPILEIECAPTDIAGVVDSIAGDPEVVTIHVTTGRRDLVVILLCTDLEELRLYVKNRISALPTITKVRTQLRVSGFDARNWRLRVLDTGEVSGLGRPTRHSERQSRRTPAEEQVIFDSLFRNARATAKDLGDALGTTAARAGLLVDQMIDEEQIVLRAEVARPLSGWPVLAWYFLRTNPIDRPDTVLRLARLKETRAVGALIGDYDVALAVWVRSMDDLDRLEIYLQSQFPDVTIVDRSIVLETPLHLNAVIAANGLRVDRPQQSPTSWR